MPNYQEVVIPKTELYFRSILQERLDITVETHLWRRQLVVIKRFRFDFLTRDNIKYFKREANIFKVLKHEHIVRFFGIVIDPPSIGIVMEYGSNGDLFQQLERNRKTYVEDMEKKSLTQRSISKISKRASISLLSAQFVSESWNSDNMSTSSDDQPPESKWTGGDDDQDPERPSNYGTRSTVGWQDRGKGIGSRIANRIGLVTHRSQLFHQAGASIFETLTCAHQV